SGTGSAGMEATVVNLIAPGDSMIVCVNGVFGARMVDVAERAGAQVTKVEKPWGEVFSAEDLTVALAAKPKVVGIVMAETSTDALHAAVRLIQEERLESGHARHMKNHKALRAGLAALGIKYSTQEGHILPQLNAVFVPAGVDDAAIRSALLNRFGIEIGAGLGAYKGKVWRIGLMGFGSRPANVLLFLSALEQLLAEQGFKFERGASIAAANTVYLS